MTSGNDARSTTGADGSRWPCLDGLRAVSVGLVLFSHCIGTAGFPLDHDTARSLGVGHLGRLGVAVFFVISGFLITSLLLRELDRSGTIRLRRFYFRRTMRIFPAYYAFLAVIAVLAAVGYAELKEGDLFHAFTYTMNFHEVRGWLLGHTWSLSVEEQFYLLWPAILVLAGRRGGLALALFWFAVSPLVRHLDWTLRPEGREMIGNSFHTVADALAIGCALAGYRDRLHAWRPYAALLEAKAFFLIPLLGIAVFIVCDERPRLAYMAGTTVVLLCAALTLDRLMTHPRTLAGRVLSLAPMVRVGAWSYGLYLCQQIFLDRRSPGPLTAFPVNLVLAFLAAWLLHRLVERPFMDLRARLEPKLFR